MDGPEAPTATYLDRLIEERERQYQMQFGALRSLMDERDRLYDARFRAAEIAVSAALAGQEKAVSSAFTASEKAVLKAEQAQKEYNERSNEFRGQLDDQAKTLMPRPETLNLFRAMEEKITGVQNVLESKVANLQSNGKAELEAVRNTFDKTVTGMSAEVVTLREYRSTRAGKDELAQQAGTQKQWAVGLMVAIVLALLGFGLSIFSAVFRK